METSLCQDSVATNVEREGCCPPGTWRWWRVGEHIDVRSPGPTWAETVQPPASGREPKILHHWTKCPDFGGLSGRWQTLIVIFFKINLRGWNCESSGLSFATCQHWKINQTHNHVSFALRGENGLVYKDVKQLNSLPYPGVLRGTYDATNGAVRSILWKLLLFLIIFSVVSQSASIGRLSHNWLWWGTFVDHILPRNARVEL